MNRRALFVRTIATAASASVFTAVGWLMGTRTLTMTVVASPFPACCNQSVFLNSHFPGPICANPRLPCPPSGGSGQWGQCAWDCYAYNCSTDPATWCYTFCFDIGGNCCSYTDCSITP